MPLKGEGTAMLCCSHCRLQAAIGMACYHSRAGSDCTRRDCVDDDETALPSSAIINDCPTACVLISIRRPERRSAASCNNTMMVRTSSIYSDGETSCQPDRLSLRAFAGPLCQRGQTLPLAHRLRKLGQLGWQLFAAASSTLRQRKAVQEYAMCVCSPRPLFSVYIILQ
jgi:hypothetical protein